MATLPNEMSTSQSNYSVQHQGLDESDEIAADISQPGGAELSGQGAQARRLWASGNFGCGCVALNTCIEKSIIFAKIFKLRVGSLCQYLLLWQTAVRSPQRSFRSVTLGNLPGTRYGDRLNVWTTELLARWT